MSTLRRNIMLGTAGHVDHGKSALVKLLTGCETDTLTEEKQRGLTIDLGFAPCRLADQRVVGIVDVPGHVDFIRNMVAGAHGIDLVLFVVAADDGIMPQTLEHLQILTLMGLRHGVVALTKIDLVDAARRDTVVQDVRRLLADTFLASAPICPLSNLTGEGFDAFFDALNQQVNACGNRPCSGGFRVWVADTFTIRGSGTVVTGIPTHGRVQPGDRLHLLPPGWGGHVRRLQVYGEEAAEGLAGECVALNLPELDHEAVKRGMVLCGSTAMPPVTMAEAELRLLGTVKGSLPDYVAVHVHIGTAAVVAHVAMLEQNEMRGGQSQMVQLRLAEALPLVPGERFVVRAPLPGVGGLTTIGGGRILGRSNVRLRRRRLWTLDALTARREVVDQPERWCERMLQESTAPLTVNELQKRCLGRSEELAAFLEGLRAGGRATATPNGAWLHVEVIGGTAAKVLAAVESFHATHPERAGVARGELQAQVEVHAELFAMAVASLQQTGQLQSGDGPLALASWQPRLQDRDERLSERIAAILKQAGWTPPSLEEVAATLAESPKRVEALARLLSERGILVRLDDRIWMHRDAVAAGQEMVLKLFARSPKFSTMAFRDALGVSRKFAVPLLDYLDRVRFTVRFGHDRTPGVEARKRLADVSHPPAAERA